MSSHSSIGVRVLAAIAGIIALSQLTVVTNLAQTPLNMLSAIVLPRWLQIGIALLWMCLFSAYSVLAFATRQATIKQFVWILVPFVLVNTTRAFWLTRADYESGRLGLQLVFTFIFVLISLAAVAVYRQQQPEK